jgi:hypothetical protein
MFEVDDERPFIFFLLRFSLLVAAFSSCLVAVLCRLGGGLAMIVFQLILSMVFLTLHSILRAEILFFVASFSVYPKSIIHEAIVIVELPLSASLIFEEIAFIQVPIRPVIYAKAVLFIQHIVPLIAFTTLVRIIPHSIPVSEALLEVSTVNAAILPGILSKPLRQPIYEFSFKFVSIEVVLHSLSVLEAVLEVSEIEIACISDHLPFVFSCCPSPSGRPPHQVPSYCSTLRCGSLVAALSQRLNQKKVPLPCFLFWWYCPI